MTAEFGTKKIEIKLSTSIEGSTTFPQQYGNH